MPVNDEVEASDNESDSSEETAMPVEPKSKKDKKNKNKNKRKLSVDADSQKQDSEDKPSPPPSKKSKKKKSKAAKESTETRAAPQVVPSEQSPPSGKKNKHKKKDQKHQEVVPVKPDESTDKVEDKETPVKKKKNKQKNKESKVQGFAEPDWNDEDEGAAMASTPVIPEETPSKKKAKKTNSSPSIVNTTPPNQPIFIKRALAKSEGRLTASEVQKRRINFALSQNKCQSFLDIDRSMQESPDIPFDAKRRPKQGVLKAKAKAASANSTPEISANGDKKTLHFNTMMNGRSKAAKKLANSSRLSLGGRI